MGNLAFDGVSSLSAINSWISLIDTNITNAKRIGYKSTRLTVKDNVSNVIGKTNINTQIVIPSASLVLDTTTIADYEQGSLTPTGNVSDIALNGRGFFVVEEVETGFRYLTRDGQFNFDGDGYLVNADGLRVLSAGQDYIRVPVTERFSLDFSGVTMDQAKYGDRQLMVVNLVDTSKLFYSKYGFTTFEAGDFIPIEINNDFYKTMDGLNPYLANKTGVNYENFYYHDKINQKVHIDQRTNEGRASISAHTFKDFTTLLRFSINDANVLSDLSAGTHKKFTGAPPATTDFKSFGVFFGQKERDDDLSVPNTPTATNSSGFWAGVINDGGTHRLRVYAYNGTTTPTVVATGPAIANLVQGTDYELSLIVDEGNVFVNLFNRTTNTSLSTITLTGQSYSAGYAKIGALDLTGLGPPPTGGIITLDKLEVQEINKETFFNIKIIGGTADSFGTKISQSFVEESTALMSDNLVMLSNVQKIFSAVSKIINVNNSLTDDMNALIR